MDTSNQYWCHLCRKQFIPTQLIQCPICKNDFCELIDNNSNNDPRSFIPYGMENNQQPLQQQRQTQQQLPLQINAQTTFITISNIQNPLMAPSAINQLMAHLFPRSHQNFEQSFEQMIQMISFNESKPNGPEPASEVAIQGLERVQIKDENLECCVCKDNFEIGKFAIKLNCNHMFDEDCIIKWLRCHGVCPICRAVVANINQ